MPEMTVVCPAAVAAAKIAAAAANMPPNSRFMVEFVMIAEHSPEITEKSRKDCTAAGNTPSFPAVGFGVCRRKNNPEIGADSGC